MTPEKICLGYWKIRGKGEALRMLLHYAEIDFNDVMYECGDAPDFDRSAWLDVKFTLGLDFPNLPYLIDGETKLTQSITILHYLSVKTGLVPKSQTEFSRCDMLDHVGLDLALLSSRLFYSSPADFAANKPATVNKAKEFIQQFSDALGNRKFFAGEDISGTDFWLFECIDRFVKLQPDIVEQENIKDFRKRIMSLPTLQKYFSAEDSSRNLPLNNKRATFK